MSWDNTLLIITVVVIIIIYMQQSRGNTERTTSTIDNKGYFVQNLSDKQAAADYIARIAASLTSLVRHMVAKYPDNVDVKRMYARFDATAISEGSIESGYTSYSVNKGQRIVLCIRQGDKSFVDFDTMLYVAIHELAHVMTLEIDHPPSFWSNFKFLIQEAISIGIYNKKDFTTTPVPYCGININNSVV